ncbi:hypothetical protein evm_001663 [Chilo suppressalis]|nr:hypothetical protein evm_001663 [Chilo suppressalis]
MASTVKCNTCNIVIDELLAFVQNKISIMDEDTLVRLCVTSFKSDEITQSKSLLFESLPSEKRKILRKRQGKENRDMMDIITLFKGTDPEFIPVFVARELEKLPPITWDHLDATKILKDLLILQSDLKDIKSKYVTSQQLEDLRNEMNSKITSPNRSTPNRFRNIHVNKKRGACVDSGPIGLTHMNSSLTDCDLANLSYLSNLNCNNERKSQEYPPNKTNTSGRGALHITLTGRETGFSREPVTAANQLCNTSTPIASASTAYCENAIPKTTFAEKVRSDGEWKLVQRRKTKMNYRYHGTTGVSQDDEGKFKAAVNKVPIFITKVHKDTTDSDIRDYVYKKTKENITLEKISFKRERGYKAYKFFVSEQKLSVFLDSNLWPQGIIALQETWLLPDDIQFLSHINKDFGWTGTSAVDTEAGMLRGRPFGGVALLWDKRIFRNVSIVKCDNPRICAIKVCLGQRSFLVFSVYMPTDKLENITEFTDCLSLVSAIISNDNIETVYILGDFNAHPYEPFFDELSCFCSEQDWVCADTEVLGLNSGAYTYISEAHGCSRTGPVYNEMIESRINFKSRLKWCQNHSEQLKMDMLSSKHSKHDFRKFWKATKSLNGKHSLPVSVDGVNDIKSITDLFREQFTVKSPRCSSHSANNMYDMLGPCNREMGTRFLAKDVKNAIQSMSHGKSPGHDGLSIEHLRYAGPHLPRVLAMFYSLCIGHSYLPADLMKTVVVPIVKNKTGDVCDKSNYRPISLATIVAKVLDILLNAQLDDYLILHDNQFEFNIILKFWYENQVNVVRWANTYSQPYRMECGVRQGGLTSPRLFNLYIDALIGELSGSRVGCHIDGTPVNNINYADDMVLLSASVCDITKMLKICENYAREHGLIYNVKKSECMVFKVGGKSSFTIPSIKLYGTPLQFVDKFKYLGHIVTSDLDDDADIERERRALSVRANMVARRLARSSAEVKRTLFRSYCTNFYTSSLWLHHTQKQYSALSVQYNNAFRVLIGLPRYCSASGMFADAQVDCFFTIMTETMCITVRFGCTASAERCPVTGVLGPVGEGMPISPHCWGQAFPWMELGDSGHDQPTRCPVRIVGVLTTADAPDQRLRASKMEGVRENFWSPIQRPGPC